MSEQTHSTIAQLLYADPPAPNFARLVAGMERALGTFRAQDRKLDWNDDDLAIFDTDHCRIALQLTEGPGGGHAACLTVAVGPSPAPHDAEDGPFVPQHLCSALVEQIATELPCDAVLWSEATGLVTADTLDMLIDALPTRADIDRLVQAHDREEVDDDFDVVLPADVTAPRAQPALMPLSAKAAPVVIGAGFEGGADPVSATAAGTLALASADPVEEAEIIPFPERARDPELERLRAALYPAREGLEVLPEQSVRMRLAVHSLNATMMIVLLPLGAAVTTYTILRGADMRVTGRAMALAGFGLMVAKAAALQGLIG